ncbi:hypothetical protein [Arthrobacter sp. STN4]|nr:hypothetical protein [Arthrobacter sp. STN4]
MDLIFAPVFSHWWPAKLVSDSNHVFSGCKAGWRHEHDSSQAP